MASQPNAWHTANRNRNPPSANRTPQNRSGNASPAPSFTPSQPPKQDTKQSGPSNAWAQRNAGDRNGPQEEAHVPLNGFNAAEIKAFLGREAAPTPYKPQEVGGARAGGGAWGQKPNHMANGQPFFTQLAKQVAAFEGGG